MLLALLIGTLKEAGADCFEVFLSNIVNAERPRK